MRGGISREIQILRCLRRELDDVIRPELSTDRAQKLYRRINEILASLVAEHSIAITDASSVVDWKSEQHHLESVKQQMTTELGAEVECSEDPLDVVSLQNYFDQQSDGPGNIESVEQIVGGFSKDTWKVQADPGLKHNRHMILRRDLSFGPIEDTVSTEVRLLQELHGYGLPVPEPLWHSADKSSLGQPFLMFPQLPGKAVFDEWDASEDIKWHVFEQIAWLMARLHTLPVGGLNSITAKYTNAMQSPFELVRAHIQGWYDQWRRRRVEHSYIVEKAFEWLLENVPSGLDDVALVHGDFGLHNTLINGDKLTALLDWEMWHLGDPIEDLSYLKLSAEQHVNWHDFMDAYRRSGGSAYDQTRAEFYAVWRSVRNATCCATSWYGFLNGYYPFSTPVYQGVILFPFFIEDLAQQLDKAVH